MPLDIVEFPFGGYGVRKRHHFGHDCYTVEYNSTGDPGKWWALQEYVEEYCVFNTAKKAVERLAYLKKREGYPRQLSESELKALCSQPDKDLSTKQHKPWWRFWR